MIITALMVLAVVAALGVAIPLFFRVVVPTNMVHIVQSSTKTISYGRDKPAGNTYYSWPTWIPKYGISVSKLPVSIFPINLTEYEGYDENRLPFFVDITAFFRIEDSEKTAQRASDFVSLQRQLESVLQGSIRKILGTNTLEEIMGTRQALGQQFTDEVANELREWGIVPVKNVEIMDLKDTPDSKVIHEIMSKHKARIEKESRIAIAENMREAELKEIDAKRTVEVQRQDAAQQIGLRTAEKDREVGIANEKSKQEVQAQAKVTAEKNMDVVKVQEVRKAEIVRDIAVVKADQDKQVAVVQAAALKETTVLNAEGEKTSNVLKAEGIAQASRLEGEGIRSIGLAKAEAETALLMAPVQTQITLAKEIGANEPYQKYLVSTRQIDVGGEVGKEMAKAIAQADIKVIANSGDIQSGVASLGDMFSPKGGTSLTGMLAALGQTEEGKALVEKVTGAVIKPVAKKTSKILQQPKESKE